MATRRTTKVDVPLTPTTNGNTSSFKASSPSSTNLDAPPATGSPFLPTTLESLLLAIYPSTLLLGSLFSSLAPATRHAPYNTHSQSYDPAHAPNYFARKSNAFNVYFVKIGWFWITLAFFALVGTHGSFGEKGGKGWTITRRRW